MVKPDYISPDGTVTLYCADCLDVLNKISADLLLTDPPFGIGEDGGKFRGRLGEGHRVLPKKGWDTNRPHKEYFDLMRGASDQQIIWGGNYFADLLPASRGWLYWNKLMGGDFSDGELAWTSAYMPLRSFTYCNKEHGKEHPTQKPVQLMQWCLSFFPGARVVLDPYMGVGTTGIACVKTGRRFIGIDRERDYFDIAVRRVEQAFADTALFREAEPRPVQQEMFGETK